MNFQVSLIHDRSSRSTGPFRLSSNQAAPRFTAQLLITHGPVFIEITLGHAMPR